jgi:hypothetical protein
VQLAKGSDKTTRQFEQELGLSEELLKHWLRRMREDGKDFPATDDSKRMRPNGSNCGGRTKCCARSASSQKPVAIGSGGEIACLGELASRGQLSFVLSHWLKEVSGVKGSACADKSTSH